MTSNYRAMLFAALIVFSVSAEAQAQSCSFSFRSIFSLFTQQNADWRAGTTNRSEGTVELSKESERNFKAYRDHVIEAVYTRSSTVPIDIEVHRNASLTTIRPPANYGTGKFPKYEVEGVSDGKVGIVLGLPVSGHTGAEDAARWAKTDLYNVRIEKEVNGVYQQHRLINKQQSQDATTFHELELQMEKGVNYKISYWRDGSAGPHGYPEGRFIELVWNGQ